MCGFEYLLYSPSYGGLLADNTSTSLYFVSRTYKTKIMFNDETESSV